MTTPAPPIVDQPRRIVVVEDDEAFRVSIARTLQLAQYDVAAFADAESASRHLQDNAATVVLTDLRLPRADGLSVLSCAKQRDADVPVVVMTAHGDVPTAIQSIRAGAYDFLEKPFGRDQLLAVIARASDQYGLVLENRVLRRHLEVSSGITRVLLGESKPLRDLRELVLRLAPTPADALIEGETGTGKELVARCLHDFSRRSGNFVAVNCAAVPEALFESELFGHEAGAYTGAAKQRIGKIEHAKNGTLFLDEVEAMPMPLQAKVLRVLQERELERLGSNQTIPVDFRVVAATKTSLEQLAERGEFRADLLYRLNVVKLRVPALRERVGDILPLFQYFLESAAVRYQIAPVALSSDDHQALLTSRWPGNVRELKACAERFLLGLPIFADDRVAPANGRSLDESVALMERSLIEEALRQHQGSVRGACGDLKLTLATMYRKLKLLSIDPASYKGSRSTDD